MCCARKIKGTYNDPLLCVPSRKHVRHAGICVRSMEHSSIERARLLVAAQERVAACVGRESDQFTRLESGIDGPASFCASTVLCEAHLQTKKNDDLAQPHPCLALMCSEAKAQVHGAC